MPPNSERYAGHIEIDGLPYMLATPNQAQPGMRIWRAGAIPTQTVRRTAKDEKYGIADAVVEVPFAYEKFDGGFADSEGLVEGGYGYSRDQEGTSGFIMPSPEIQFLTLNDSLWSADDWGAFDTSKLLDFDGKTWHFVGKRLVLSDAADALTQGHVLGTHIWWTDAAVFGSFVYAATEASGNEMQAIQRLAANNGAATELNATLIANHLVVAEDLLYRSYHAVGSGMDEGAWRVSSVAMGASVGDIANWTTPNDPVIGSGDAAVTRLISHDGMPVVAKTDGIYIYDPTRDKFQNLLPASTIAPSADNGKASMSWGDFIFYNTQDVLWALQFIDGSWARFNVTPGYGRQNDTVVAGPVRALAPGGDFIYAIVQETNTATNNYWLLKGRRVSFERFGTPIIWDTYFYVAGNFVRTMGVSPLTGGSRLYGLRRDTSLASGSSGKTISIFWRLPSAGGNPIHASGYHFAHTDGINDRYYHGRDDLGAPTTKKVWRTISLEAHASFPGGEILALGRIDGGTWATLGVMTSANAPFDTFTWGSNFGYSHEIATSVTRLNGSQSPALRKIIGTASARPAVIRTSEALIRCANRPLLRHGTQDNRDGADIAIALASLAATGPVELITPTGEVRTVLIQQPVEQVESAEYGNDQEILAQVRMIDWP
jgi:hypothetical protein